MAVNLSPVGGVAAQFLDNNGNVLTGGKIYTYASGTTTPQAVFTSATGTTAHSNPIILDASGRVPSGEIWLTDGLQYKFVIKTADEVTIGTYENIIGINSNFVNFTTSEEVQIATAGQTVFTLTTMQYAPGTNNLVVYVDGVNQVEGGSYSFVETSSTVVTFTSGLHVGAVVKFVSAELLSTGVVDSGSVVYQPAGSGAVATNVQTKLRETVSVKDFGAVGDGVTDDTAAIQAALTAGAGCSVYFPGGTYKITATLSPASNTRLFGDGPASLIKTTVMANGTYGQSMFLLDGLSNIVFENLGFDDSGITTFLAATRCIRANNSSYIWVKTCKFVTCGAATAFTQSHHYYITNNDILISSTDGDIHNDGIIDNWWGSYDFVIDGNIIRSNIDEARYGILVTGQTSAGVAAACHDFAIVNNQVKNMEEIGIWVNGRNGVNYSCVVSNNIVDDVRDFFGISIYDTNDCVVSNNIVKNTYFSAINVGAESGAYAGCTNVVVSNNTIIDSTTSGSTSDTNSAIVFLKCNGGVVSGNNVSGATHPKAVFFSSDSSYCRELGGQYNGGTENPPVLSASATSIVNYGSYTMTRTPVTNVTATTFGRANWSVTGNIVTVYFKVGIQATSSGSTSLRLSLPIAVDILDADNWLFGSANNSFGQPASVSGDATNNAALLTFDAPSAATYVFYGSFSYKIL